MNIFKEIINLVAELLQLSPPMMLSVVLFVIGWYLKKSRLMSWMIPPILGLAGALIWPLFAQPMHLDYEVKNWFALHAIYGLALGAVPTFVWETFQEWRNREKTPDGKTRFFMSREEHAIKRLDAANVEADKAAENVVTEAINESIKQDGK